VGEVLRVATEGGRQLRIVVNCAGIGAPHKVLGKDGPFPLELLRQTIEVNLLGSFNVLRLAAAVMLAQEPVGEAA
jgi:NAD(P)-dependent dehydrogenase (short-subunit alcohol dehydrogenase family)